MEQTFLKPEEYWEWRTTIAEMDLAHEKLAKAHDQVIIAEKDLEIRQLKIKLYKLNELSNLKTSHENYKNEYELMKKKIEERIGISLNNKVISDETFEVKELPEPKNP